MNTACDHVRVSVNQSHAVPALRTTHPLKVEEVFLQGLAGLGLLALVDDVGVLLVAAALVVLTAVGLPVAQTHPAEVWRHTHINTQPVTSEEHALTTGLHMMCCTNSR